MDISKNISFNIATKINVLKNYIRNIIADGGTIDETMITSEWDLSDPLIKSNANFIMLSGAHKSGVIYGMNPKTGALMPITYSNSGVNLGMYVDSTGQLQSPTQNLPYLKYDSDTLALKGYGWERAVVQYCKTTDNLNSASWSSTDITRTPDNAVAPDGTTTAILITEGSAGTALLNTTSATHTDNVNIANSIFVKPVANITWIRLQILDSTGTNGWQGWFNVQTGVVGSNSLVGTGGVFVKLGIEYYSKYGYYKIEITGKAGSTNTTTMMQIMSASGDGLGRQNNASYLLWGPQIENLTTSSSYFKNSGTGAVSKSAYSLTFPDTITGNADVSTYAEYEYDKIDGNNYILLRGGDLSARIMYDSLSSFTDTRVGLYDGTNSILSASAAILSRHKAMTYFGGSGMKSCKNGSAVATRAYDGTIGTDGTGLTAPSSSSANSPGTISYRKVVTIPKLLSDVNIQSLTT